MRPETDHRHSRFRSPVSSLSPSSIRDKNWKGIQASMNARQEAVYEAWLRHGPGTTREVAAKCGLDILAFRPRTTELHQCGLVRLIGIDQGQGIYRVSTAEELRELRESASSGQQLLL
ncbi:MAG TPA: hypothetical protein PKI20_13490 [Verrucomicrobiota bacterium]|nr:hypothetical protein [Verrucomicrobiota bacterium]